MIDTPHLIEALLVFAITLLASLQVWVVKQIIDLKNWRTEIETTDRIQVTKLSKIEAIDTWMTEVKATMQPDKELRSQLPVVLHNLQLHSNILNDVNTKLGEVITKIGAVETNCLMHKMIGQGKTDKLIKFIREELDQE